MVVSVGGLHFMNLFQVLDSYIDEQIKQNLIPGAVLLIGKDRSILHEKAYGLAQKWVMKENGETDYLKQCATLQFAPLNMTTAHLFDLASITKVLATTFAIMLLLDQNQIQLDDTVSAYLPDFNQPDKRMITLRHLLSHTSGLTPWKPLYLYDEDPIRLMAEQPLHHSIGERQYSDLDFMILKTIIEKVSEQSLDEFLYAHLYAKLDLIHTRFNPHAHHYPIVSTSHGNPFEYKMVTEDDFAYPGEEKKLATAFNRWRRYTLTGEVNDGNAYHVFSGVGGQAGLFSTAKEIYLLLKLLLDQGRYKRDQLLSSHIIQEFITLTDTGHGLGWAMSDHHQIGDLPLGKLANAAFLNGAIGHTGFTGSFVLAIPKQQFIFILLTNVQNSGVNKEGRYPNLKLFRETTLTKAIEICST